MSDESWSTSFDAGRLQWLRRARQMEAQRDELERVARWKLLSSGGGASSGAAAPGTTIHDDGGGERGPSHVGHECGQQRGILWFFGIRW